MSGTPLLERYPADAVAVFDAAEARRFLDPRGRPRDREQVAWELLYRLEPDLYERLVAGEHLHPDVLRWLPVDGRRVLEIGAGGGRLTLDVVARCAALTAVEPAAPLRRRLRERLDAAGHGDAAVLPGFFDELPVAPRSQEVVVSCSAFSPHRERDPEAALRSMESVCAPGGMIVLVWPDGVDWLTAHGFEHVVFGGPMAVVYTSAAEATLMARIFHPAAAATVERLASAVVAYETLAVNPPRDLCWKRCASP